MKIVEANVVLKIKKSQDNLKLLRKEKKVKKKLLKNKVNKTLMIFFGRIEAKIANLLLKNNHRIAKNKRNSLILKILETGIINQIIILKVLKRKICLDQNLIIHSQKNRKEKLSLDYQILKIFKDKNQ